ncbi:hypothetical protein RFI_13107 [Reticulomyxa filosa]|uniref:Uncharacterized protein n=1 Tax=Reticulomyxa filosa TaxID=46433 RepID=X6NDH4_RETFI|nr:hypothetical protein RFI_13107 [Reticulomyxa filosa]|eukprot:ETO24051.1 hypothetical protein RFI_13107 [Reticulomyxa filosa]
MAERDKVLSGMEENNHDNTNESLQRDQVATPIYEIANYTQDDTTPFKHEHHTIKKIFHWAYITKKKKMKNTNIDECFLELVHPASSESLNNASLEDKPNHSNFSSHCLSLKSNESHTSCDDYQTLNDDLSQIIPSDSDKNIENTRHKHFKTNSSIKKRKRPEPNYSPMTNDDTSVSPTVPNPNNKRRKLNTGKSYNIGD